MISEEDLKKLKSYLKSIKEFSEKENWDESYAQALVMSGAFYYDKIFKTDERSN
jgi:hypothetical protein